MTTPRCALFHDGQQISKAHSTREAAEAEAYAHGAIINRAADFPGDEEARRVFADGYEIRALTDDDPFITQPERVAEIAQRAFGDAKDAALAENKRLGIKSYGTVTDPPKSDRSSYVSNEDFRQALDKAPPGIIDPRSWAYWNNTVGRYPTPPLPRRTFG